MFLVGDIGVSLHKLSRLFLKAQHCLIYINSKLWAPIPIGDVIYKPRNNDKG